MPIGAENIGTAYVRVIADGKDFDLKDMLRGHEGDGEMEGRRLGKAYEKGFVDEWRSKPNQTRLRNAITDAMVRGDAAKMFTATRNFQNFKAGLIKEYGEIGRRAGENFERELDSGRLDLDGFRRRIVDLNRDLVRAEDELNAEVTAARRKAHAEWMDMLNEAYRMNGQVDRQRARQLRNTIAGNNALIKTYRQLTTDIDLMTRGEVEHGLRVSEVARRLRTLRAELEGTAVWTREMEVNLDRHHDALLRMNVDLNGHRATLLKVADATGAAFGRGSRNDFLNFVGSVARNAVALGAYLIDLAGYFRGLGRRIRDVGTIGGAVKLVLRDLGGSLGKVVAGISGLFLIIGPLLSVLSGLGGIVLALVASMGGALLGAVSALGSTLAYGLGGGAAIAATALVPLAAGIGVFALAVKNADKDTKQAFKSIGKSFSGLGQTASSSTFGNIAEQASRFKAIIGDLTPLVESVGGAISRVGDRWLDMMEGGGFRAFRRALEDFLPNAVFRLGVTIGNITAGLAGMFRAAIPESQEFLKWLQGITGEFRRWANSIQGQQDLAAFFSRAAESAKDLGHFVQALGGFLREVFRQARADGDGLFEGMADGLDRWTKVIRDNPDIMKSWMDSMKAFGEFTGSVRDLLIELLSAGQKVGDSLFASMSRTIDGWVRTLQANPDILRGWYDSVAAFARALGDVTIGIGKVFDALDNTFSRSAITAVFEGLAAAIDLAAGGLEAIASIFGESGNDLLQFAGTVTGAAVAIGLLNKALSIGVAANLASFITNLRSAETRMTALAGAAKVAAGAGGLLLFQQGAQQSNDAASILMQTIGGAATGFAFGGPWGALIGGAAGTAMALFGRKTDDAAASVADAAPEFANMASTLDQITGAATAATRAQVLQAAASSGALAQAKNFGISARDLVSASLGFKDAQDRVNAALQSGQSFTVAYRDEFGTLFTTQADGKKKLAQLTAELEAQGYTLDSVSKKATDLAGQQAVLDFIGKAGNEWSGLTKKVRENFLATQDLSELQGKIKPKILTKIEATGIAPTISGVAKVAAKYDLMPKQVKSILSVLGVDLSVKKILALQAELDRTDRKRPKPKIDSDTSAANARLAELRANLDTVGRIHKTPKVTVDAGAANSAINGIRANLEALRDKNILITETHRRVFIGGAQNPTPTAAGGLFNYPSVRLIGEAGPEAVVPLARNLSQVDPSVRALSAIAQGKVGVAPTGTVKTVSADGWTIVTPTSDPEAVAREVFDRLAGAGY